MVPKQPRQETKASFFYPPNIQMTCCCLVKLGVHLNTQMS